MNRLKAVLLLLIITCSCLPSAAQQHVQDLSRERLSRERAAILNELRAAVSKELGQDVKFVVAWLKVYKGFAFVRGRVQAASGKEIDFAAIPAYKDAVSAGAFDGDATMALLRKTGGQWRYITHTIGPTDMPYACWWKEFGAPRQVFDLSEDCLR